MPSQSVQKDRRPAPRRLRALIGLMILVLLPAARLAAADTNTSASERWQNAKEGSSNAWEKVKDGSVQTWEKVEHGSSNAWHTVKSGTTQAWDHTKEKFGSGSGKTNYVYQQKDKFVAHASAELSDLDQKIKQFSDKAAGAGSAANAEAQQKLQTIRDQRGSLEEKFNEAKTATENQWNKAQPEFQKAYDQTKESMKEAWDWLKEKTGG
jgi:hypothetical protein